MSEIKIMSIPDELRTKHGLSQETKAIETKTAAGIMSNDAGMEYDVSPRITTVSLTNAEGFRSIVEVNQPRIAEILTELTEMQKGK